MSSFTFWHVTNCWNNQRLINAMYTASNCNTSGLRFSILAHIRKPTVCHGRAELGFSIKLRYDLTDTAGVLENKVLSMFHGLDD